MKAIVIDPIFPSFINKEYYVDSSFLVKGLISGKEGKFYRLKENEDDVICSCFGENQIKIIDG